MAISLKKLKNELFPSGYPALVKAMDERMAMAAVGGYPFRSGHYCLDHDMQCDRFRLKDENSNKVYVIDVQKVREAYMAGDISPPGGPEDIISYMMKKAALLMPTTPTTPSYSIPVGIGTSAATWGTGINYNIMGGSGTTLTISSVAGTTTTQIAAPLASQAQHLKSGDLIVCKNDHPICIVMEDFEVGVTEGDWRDKMGFWQQDKTPSSVSAADYDCAICRASFCRQENGSYKFILRDKKEDAA